MAHQGKLIPKGILSLKWLEVLPLSLGWDASLLPGLPQHENGWHAFIHLGEEKPKFGTQVWISTSRPSCLPFSNWWISQVNYYLIHPSVQCLLNNDWLKACTETWFWLTRPTEMCENPEMIYAISSFSIKQVRDCMYLSNLVKSSCKLNLATSFKLHLALFKTCCIFPS